MEGAGIDMATSINAATTASASKVLDEVPAEEASVSTEDQASAPAPRETFPGAAAIAREYAKHREANLARNAQLLRDLKITSEVEALTAGIMRPTPRRRGPNKPKEPVTEIRRSGRLVKNRYEPFTCLATLTLTCLQRQ